MDLAPTIGSGRFTGPFTMLSFRRARPAPLLLSLLSLPLLGCVETPDGDLADETTADSEDPSDTDSQGEPTPDIPDEGDGDGDDPSGDGDGEPTTGDGDGDGDDSSGDGDGEPSTDSGGGCNYPGGAVEPMALGEVLSPYSWPVANRADGTLAALDLGNAPCANDDEIDWSIHDLLVFISVPAW